MKAKLFALALLAPALSWGSETTRLHGIDQHGQKCEVIMEKDHGPGARISLKFKDYQFHMVPMTSDGKMFDGLTMDYGNGVYSLVIGAPITISKVGLIHVKGSTDMNAAGQMTKAEMTGKGGLLNWWSRRFICKDLR